MSNYQLGTICLYGTQAAGFGWIAQVHGRDGLLGDGEPRASVGMTEAIIEATTAALKVGLSYRATVEVLSPGGESRTTFVPYHRDVMWAGNLKWVRL